MAERLTLSGIVHPERAQLSMGPLRGVVELHPGVHVQFTLSILLNRILVFWDTELKPDDIYTVRNQVQTVIESQLAAITFCTSNYYSVELTRAHTDDLTVDVVFGIDVGVISEHMKGSEIDIKKFLDFYMKNILTHDRGILVSRCFLDLTHALRYSSDTGFYCYRAIESLMQHSRLMSESDSDAWVRFRRLTGVQREAIDAIKSSADFSRHGKPEPPLTGDQRGHLLKATWDVVLKYIRSIQENSASAMPIVD